MAKGKDDANKPAGKSPEGPSDEFLLAVVAKVTELIEPSIKEMGEVLQANAQSAADTLENLLKRVESLEAEAKGEGPGLSNELIEAVAGRVVQIIDPAKELSDYEILNDGRVHQLDVESKRQGDVLAKLCEEYSEARKTAVADWREYAGEEFDKAQQASTDAQRSRRKAMGKLCKYEQDNPDLKRGTDSKHAELVSKANEAVEEVAKSRRKATELKSAAMEAVAS